MLTYVSRLFMNRVYYWNTKSITDADWASMHFIIYVHSSSVSLYVTKIFQNNNLYKKTFFPGFRYLA